MVPFVPWCFKIFVFHKLKTTFTCIQPVVKILFNLILHIDISNFFLMLPPALLLLDGSIYQTIGFWAANICTDVSSFMKVGWCIQKLLCDISQIHKCQTLLVKIENIKSAYLLQVTLPWAGIYLLRAVVLRLDTLYTWAM